MPPQNLQESRKYLIQRLRDGKISEEHYGILDKRISDYIDKIRNVKTPGEGKGDDKAEHGGDITEAAAPVDKMPASRKPKSGIFWKIITIVILYTIILLITLLHR